MCGTPNSTLGHSSPSAWVQCPSSACRCEQFRQSLYTTSGFFLLVTIPYHAFLIVLALYPYAMRVEYISIHKQPSVHFACCFGEFPLLTCPALEAQRMSCVPWFFCLLAAAWLFISELLRLPAALAALVLSMWRAAGFTSTHGITPSSAGQIL